MKTTVRALAIALILTLLCSAAGGLAATYAPRQINHCNEYVTLRARPSGSAKALKQVILGEVVMATPYNGEFSYCCYNGTFGYIKNRYLSASVHPYSPGVFYVANCKEWISLRAMPVSDGAVLARVPLGATFDAIYYADGSYDPNAFAYVRYKGRYGWVLWRYVAPVYYPGGQ